MSRYIDVHTHVNLAAFDSDRDEVITRSLEAGVFHINVGTQKDTSKKAVELAGQYSEGVYATVGLHPVHTSKSYHDTQELGAEGKEFTSRGEAFDAPYYRTLAQNEKVVALGECGLDYYRTEPESLEKQRTAFIKQIELANELQKPLMLHIRSGNGMNAYADALALVKAHAKILGNVHFFVGSYEDAKGFWDIGFTTSFTGVITFASDYDDVVRNAPLDMIHAETDAPYATPTPHRGKRNEPHFVTHVVARIAEIRGRKSEEVTKTLRENARRVFGV